MVPLMVRVRVAGTLPFNAVCCAVETGLLASLVLSTLGRPTSVLLRGDGAGLAGDRIDRATATAATNNRPDPCLRTAGQQCQRNRNRGKAIHHYIFHRTLQVSAATPVIRI